MILKPIENNIEFKKKFSHRLSKTRLENPSLNKFIYEISLRSNLFIVGGYLRNVINDETPRDLDIIVNLSQKDLSNLVEICFQDVKRNRVGGFKIPLTNMYMDVWSVEDNWAFKKMLIKNIELNLVDKISEGTFFNYDSLVLDLHSFQTNFKYYNDCAKNKKLDILKRNSKYKRLNPTKEANVLRAFYLKNKYGLSFSDQLNGYILEQLKYTIQAFGDVKKNLVETLSKYPKYQDILSEKIITNEIKSLLSAPLIIGKQKDSNQGKLFI